MEQIDKKDKEKFEKENQINFDKIDKSKFKVVGEKPTQNERILSKPYSYWRSVGSLLVKSKAFMITLAILIVIIIMMFAVPAGQQINARDINHDGGGWGTVSHPFGYGMHGENFWVQIWAGTRTTVLFALLIMVIELLIAIVIGLLWGYFRKSDLFWINFTNLLQVIPQLVMVLFIIFLMKPGYWPVVLAVSIQSWITLAANIRVQVMLVKHEDYNVASETLGTKSGTIIRRNILPRILPVIVQQGIFAMPIAISIEATLPYLGINFINQETNTSLGIILGEVTGGSAWQLYPQLIIIPIIFISGISVIFFILGKSIADSLDPKNHR